VRRIFAAKGRPSNNPLIVHVADSDAAQRYAAHWPAAAQELARRFWPGPLTLVVRKASAIVAEATAGLHTVALRSPAHPLSLELLRRFDGPLAGPSANRSTRVSPTTAQHVRQELGDAVDCILDGGPCQVGIESTVLDLAADVPTILRPGAVLASQLAEVIGEVRLSGAGPGQSAAARSPGQQAVHYAPVATAYRFQPDQWAAVMNWCRSHPHESWAVMAREDAGQFLDELAATLASPAEPAHEIVRMPSSATEYGRILYAKLRELDALSMRTIWIQMPPDEPAWIAVRDRLTRATRQPLLP
jgi:L-threonylcarbamoyladenylate synthase